MLTGFFSGGFRKEGKDENAHNFHLFETFRNLSNPFKSFRKMEMEMDMDESEYSVWRDNHAKIEPDSKDSKYEVDPTSWKNLSLKKRPDGPFSLRQFALSPLEWQKLYNLWHGFHLDTALGPFARFEDLYMVFDTKYTTHEDSTIEGLRKTATGKGKTNQTTFKALLAWAGINDAECLKGYNQRLVNIYYFNAEKWVEDNGYRLGIIEQTQWDTPTTGRKRDETDIYLSKEQHLDPDLKITTPEWKSSFAQAYRQVMTSIPSADEIQTRVLFHTFVADFRRRAKDRRAKNKELTSEKRALIKRRKDAAAAEAEAVEAAPIPMDTEPPLPDDEKTQARNAYLHVMRATCDPAKYPRMDVTSINKQSQWAATWLCVPQFQFHQFHPFHQVQDQSNDEYYFGLVIDALLRSCSRSKEALQRHFDNPDIVNAILTYGAFVYQGREQYVSTLRDCLTESIQSGQLSMIHLESLKPIYACQMANIRTVSELGTVVLPFPVEQVQPEEISEDFKPSEIVLSTEQESIIIEAMAEFLTYF